LESVEKSKTKLVPQIETCKQSLLGKCKAPRWEANQKPSAQQMWSTSAMLPGQRHLSGKLTALFEPHHARWYGEISFEKIIGWFHSNFLELPNVYFTCILIRFYAYSNNPRSL